MLKINILLSFCFFTGSMKASVCAHVYLKTEGDNIYHNFNYNKKRYVKLVVFSQSPMNQFLPLTIELYLPL